MCFIASPAWCSNEGCSGDRRYCRVLLVIVLDAFEPLQVHNAEGGQGQADSQQNQSHIKPPTKKWGKQNKKNKTFRPCVVMMLSKCKEKYIYIFLPHNWITFWCHHCPWCCERNLCSMSLLWMQQSRKRSVCWYEEEVFHQFHLDLKGKYECIWVIYFTPWHFIASVTSVQNEKRCFPCNPVSVWLTSYMLLNKKGIPIIS